MLSDRSDAEASRATGAPGATGTAEQAPPDLVGVLRARGGEALARARRGAAATLRFADREPRGVAAGALTLALCAVVSVLAWLPLAAFWAVLARMLPAGDCAGVSGPLRMFCASRVALVNVAATIAVIAVLYRFRDAIRARAARYEDRVPAEAAFLAVPVVATVFFALVWSGTHPHTRGGLVPDPVFPALIGLFAYCAGRYGPVLDAHVARIPLPPRWTRDLLLRVAVGVPLVLLVLAGSNVRDPHVGARQQAVVLLALALAYVASRRGAGAADAP